MMLIDAERLLRNAADLLDAQPDARLTLLILADMAHAPSVSVSCGTSRHWNQARMDDWGCCENKEISTRANFTTMKGVSFGCSLWEES